MRAGPAISPSPTVAVTTASSGEARDELDSRSRLRATERAMDVSSQTQARLDAVVRLARDLFEVPVAAINFVGAEMVIPHAVSGAGDAPFERSDAMCTVAVRDSEEVYVPDTTRDQRFAESRLVVGDPGIRFYAARPVRHDGHSVGTLCVWSPEPMGLDGHQRGMLRDLASWVETEIALDKDALEARQVQQRLLPSDVPSVPGLDVAASCLPARNIGGDLYDWMMVGDRLQVALCDVMGKGIRAAVSAAGVRAVMRGTAAFDGLEPMLQRLGASLDDDPHLFATLWAARIAPSGDYSWIDAGHGLACVVDDDGTLTELSSGELPVGALPGSTWTPREGVLCPGQTLVVVSDGVLAPHPDVESAGHEIRAAVRSSDTADEVVGRLFATGRRPGAQESPDDMTALVVRRH